MFRNLVVFALALMCACTTEKNGSAVSKWMQPSDKIKVLSTIEMINDLVKEVGGERVETLALVRGQLDPHTYQLVKGDDEKLQFADIIFYNGLGLEHGPSLRQFLSESKKAVSLGDLVMQEHSELILHYNGSIDPHIWMDMSLWQKTVKHIVNTLAKYDPDHTEEYKTRGRQVERYLEELHAKLVDEMAGVPDEKRYLVTSHDAFNYFARSYLATAEEKISGDWQKRFQAPEGLAPESQLSTADIRFILDHLKKHQIQVIFPESNVSQASIQKLVNAGEEMGISVRIAPEHLYGDAIGPVGSSGENYFKMLKHNVKTISRYLNDNKSS